MLDQLETAGLGAALAILVGAAVFAIWSCCQTALHFRSADNIFERTRKHKVVEFNVRGDLHRFEFEQQYREAGMGVGSAVWDGSIVLAEYLLDCDTVVATGSEPSEHSEQSVRGRSVLELGCGLGLVSIAAARWFARALNGGAP